MLSFGPSLNLLLYCLFTAAKALVGLCVCTGSSEFPLLAKQISTCTRTVPYVVSGSVVECAGIERVPVRAFLASVIVSLG